VGWRLDWGRKAVRWQRRTPTRFAWHLGEATSQPPASRAMVQMPGLTSPTNWGVLGLDPSDGGTLTGMKRQRATHLAEQMLERLAAGDEEWPLKLVTEVYVFGSYARGAAEPHDLDVEVEIDRQHERWISHFVTCLSDCRRGLPDPSSLGGRRP
jgi:predicted nucleotidyltransferase